MNKLWIAVFLCITFTGIHAEQTKLSSYSKVQRNIFWENLYPNGDYTFYCGVKFENRSKTIDDQNLSIEHVVPANRMTEVFNCGSRTECRQNSEQFNHMEADLHNMYPALKRINSSRQDSPFGNITGENHNFPPCDYERKDGIVEPRRITRGNIARAYFYMHTEYDLPLDDDTKEMLKAWNRADPPNCKELKRNNKIEELQGTRNRFIDHPLLANDI